MQRVLLNSKLHRVTVTGTEVDYEGSVAIDQKLLQVADIREYEQIHIYDVNNGERFTSYAVPAERNSGTIAVLGAAARKVASGDLLIICTYSSLDTQEMANHQPRKIYVDENNRIIRTENAVPPKPHSVVI